MLAVSIIVLVNMQCNLSYSPFTYEQRTPALDIYKIAKASMSKHSNSVQ